MTRFAFDSLHDEARRAIGDEGLRPFTRRTGLALGLVRSLMEGRDLSVSNTLAIAEALGYEVNVQPKKYSSGFSDPDGISDLASTSAFRGGYLPIPWHPEVNFRGSSPVAFSASWLAQEGLQPDFLKAIVPTMINFSTAIAKNTVAVLDTTAEQSSGSATWCYRDGPAIGVCRAAFHEDLVVLIANECSNEVRVVKRSAPEALRLLGRVVWLGILLTDAIRTDE